MGLRVKSGLLLAAVLLTSAGCLFTPRTPEPPTSGSIEYLPRDLPENIWANAQTSLNEKDAPGWNDAISENFEYFPDSAAEAQFPPGTFDDWNKEDEMRFINAFYDSDVTIVSLMREEDYVIPPPSGDEVDWENVIYYLRVETNDDESETRYRASAIITFKLEGSFWYIYRWRDQQGESNPDNPEELLSSMGVLRGNFGSN